MRFLRKEFNGRLLHKLLIGPKEDSATDASAPSPSDDEKPRESTDPATSSGRLQPVGIVETGGQWMDEKMLVKKHQNGSKRLDRTISLNPEDFEKKIAGADKERFDDRMKRAKSKLDAAGELSSSSSSSGGGGHVAAKLTDKSADNLERFAMATVARDRRKKTLSKAGKLARRVTSIEEGDFDAILRGVREFEPRTEMPFVLEERQRRILAKKEAREKEIAFQALAFAKRMESGLGPDDHDGDPFVITEEEQQRYLDEKKYEERKKDLDLQNKKKKWKKEKSAKEKEEAGAKREITSVLDRELKEMRERNLQEVRARRELHQYNWFVQYCVFIYRQDWFHGLMLVAITLNVIFLAADRHPPLPRETKEFFELMNFFFTLIFIVECAITIVSVGFLVYWKTPQFAFDGMVVLSSIVELALTALASDQEGGGGSSLTAVRGLRLMRLFRLAKRWESLRLLLVSTYRSMLHLGNFGCLLFLMVSVFALLGQALFQTRLIFHPTTGQVTGGSRPCDFL